MTRQMSAKSQIAFAKDWLVRQGIPPETIDIASHIDSSLSYEENIKLLGQEFGIGKRGMDAPKVARGMTAAECDVAIGNFDAGYNGTSARDACVCGHQDACEDVERRKAAKAAAKAAPTATEVAWQAVQLKHREAAASRAAATPKPRKTSDVKYTKFSMMGRGAYRGWTADMTDYEDMSSEEGGAIIHILTPQQSWELSNHRRCELTDAQSKEIGFIIAARSSQNYATLIQQSIKNGTHNGYVRGKTYYALTGYKIAFGDYIDLHFRGDTPAGMRFPLKLVSAKNHYSTAEYKTCVEVVVKDANGVKYYFMDAHILSPSKGEPPSQPTHHTEKERKQPAKHKPAPDMPPILTAPAELAADVLGTGPMGLPPTATPKFKTVEDAERWLEKKYIEHGGRWKFQATPEYKKVHPHLLELYGRRNRQIEKERKQVNIVNNPYGIGYVIQFGTRTNVYASGGGMMGGMATFHTVDEAVKEAKRSGYEIMSKPKAAKPKAKKPAAKPPRTSAPDMPPALIAPAELAADVLGTGPMGLTPAPATPKRKPAARTTKPKAKKTPAAKTRKPTKKAATPKAKKTAATPKLTASQREYLAIQGFVMVKRGGKYVRITG